MDMERISKEAFAVIGKEGSTREGQGFIQRLWEDANSHFDQVAALAKRDAEGRLVGIWGAMSDEGRRFQPWEDGFTRGLYLAGVECDVSAVPPEGWTKWMVPGFVYLRVENEDGDTFAKALKLIKEKGYALVGAAHDFTDPATGKGYVCFPVEKL